MDPEVVTQFDCLQQTGKFCPSAANGPMTTSSSPSPAATPASAPSPATSANPAPSPAAVDALFALMGTPDGGLGVLGPPALSP